MSTRNRVGLVVATLVASFAGATTSATAAGTGSPNPHTGVGHGMTQMHQQMPERAHTRMMSRANPGMERMHEACKGAKH